jgi:acyl-CoA thioester hydrolase
VRAPHEHAVQLRWSDPDMLGHVNHARALALLEDARLAMGDGRSGLILARPGTNSSTVRQELVQDEQVAIRADAVMVTFDFAADASRPISEEERAHWSAFAAP